MSRRTMNKKSSLLSGGTATAVKAQPRRKTRGAKSRTTVAPPVVPRSTTNSDDDDLLLSGGGSRGFGRCGGRLMSSLIEQSLCDKLSRAGVTHSHAPRHFEVQLEDESVAAYAPMVVLRGRGREGKIVVLEAATEMQDLTLRKIAAFRRRLGPEFYVVFVGTDEVLDTVPIDVYDESCATAHLDSLVSRLAD